MTPGVKAASRTFPAVDTLAPDWISLDKLITLMSEGIPKRAVESVSNRKHTSLADLAAILGVNERTIRTYHHKDDALSPLQAEQLLKYEHLLEQGRVGLRLRRSV